MKRWLALALCAAMVAAGCSEEPPGLTNPSTPPPPEQQTPPSPEPDPPVEEVPLPRIAFSEVTQARIQVGAVMADLPLDVYGGMLRSAVEAYNRAGPGKVRTGAAPSRYTLHLRTRTGRTVSVSVIDLRTVHGATGGVRSAITSPLLVATLEPLRDALLVYDTGQAQTWFPAAPSAGWEPHPHRTGWVNAAMGLALTVEPWQSVQLSPDGNWPLMLRYPGGGVRNPVTITVRGTAHDYQAARYRLLPESTGGGLFTVPWVVSVAGRRGGLTLWCEAWGEVTPETADATRALLDEQCPELFRQITVGDLGSPITPSFTPSVSLSRQQPVLLLEAGAGMLLIFREDLAPVWLGERTPSQWQLMLQGTTPESADLQGEWVIDVAAKEAKVARIPWLRDYAGSARPFALPDGRIVGLIGNNGPGTEHVTFVIQDPAEKTMTEVGETLVGVAEIAPAGESALAYATYLPGAGRSLGPLWQYDWEKREHVQIAETGWPVGLLADGRAVAHRGPHIGELIAWRAEAPDRLETLAPLGVEPYRAMIARGGEHLFYFFAAEEPESGSASGSGQDGKTGEGPDGSLPPQVTDLAIYDVRQDRTVVSPLPMAGAVTALEWLADGSLLIQVHGREEGGTTILRASPAFGVRTLYRSADTVWYAGRDGCAVLFYRGEDLHRYWPEGCASPEPSYRLEVLGRKEQLVTGDGLIGFPAEGGLQVLDLRTGRRYLAPGITVPGLLEPGMPVPGWVRLAPIRPESGYVGLLEQREPQYVYHLVPVEPLSR